MCERWSCVRGGCGLVSGVYSLCACFAYTVSRAHVCVSICASFIWKWGSTSSFNAAARQLNTLVCVCVFLRTFRYLSIFLLFSAFHSSPLSCLILLATCSGKLLCAPIIGNLYVHRYGSFWGLSMHTLKTLKSFIWLFFLFVFFICRYCFLQL